MRAPDHFSARVAGDYDPGLAGDRTALSWTRSALNIAANGLLIARGAFSADLPVLGLIVTPPIVTVALLVWRHGNGLYPDRRQPVAGPNHQPVALARLTAFTIATAALAVVVTMASL